MLINRDSGTAPDPYAGGGEARIDCDWCGTVVPLPEGDLSGVCIECGTVVFRPGLARGRAEVTGGVTPAA